MIFGKFQEWRIAAVLAVTCPALWAGNFAPPAEGPVAFRRDAIPLDADTMAGLSRQLVTLAQALDGTDAAQRRTAAQMLAISTALDPGNGKAREVISDFEAERPAPRPETEQLEKFHARIWQILSWLESPEAGQQGQALAACLIDVMRISDPHHPRAAQSSSGELGAWKGWIPDLAAYEVKPPTQTEAAELPAADAAEKTSAEILLKKAEVSTVMWKKVGTPDLIRWEQATTSLRMAADFRKSEVDGVRQFSIFIGIPSNSGIYRQMSTMLVDLLKNHHKALPSGGRVTISCPDLANSAIGQKKQTISAAAAVLASAAISGIEPEATILGEVDRTGAFTLPADFWGQLQSLGSGNGGRLILPAAAAEHLPSLLALEQPQRFLDYEVLLASNFAELLKLSAKVPDEAVAKFMAGFREIREKSGSQPLGQYVANSFVRRRLVELVLENPNHLSAKMLAIQGAGNRPTCVSRWVLAAELRRAIEPMEWLVKRIDPNLSLSEINRLGATIELCRAQVDRLARYAEKNDRILLGHVQDLVTAIRTLERSAKSRGDNYDVHSEILMSYTALMTAYQEVAHELATVLGEVEPAPPP